MKETIDFDIQEKNMKMNNIFFIHYLLNNNINFLLTTPPCFLLPFDLIQKIKNNLIEFEKDVFDIYHFVEKNKLRIMDDTNNQIPDGHSGLEGNKKIAKIIFDKINNTKNII
jgi:hypothetical protein